MKFHDDANINRPIRIYYSAECSIVQSIFCLKFTHFLICRERNELNFIEIKRGARCKKENALIEFDDKKHYEFSL